MADELRPTGLDVIAGVPWGAHICHLFRSRNDLVDVLVPYFRAGLESNEYCVWVTAEPLGKGKAVRAMRRAVEGFDDYLAKGQILIVSHDEWYCREGVPDWRSATASWLRVHDQCLADGYRGLRVSGNVAWLDRDRWSGLVSYEKEVHEALSDLRMLAICSYPVEDMDASSLIEAVNGHQSTLVKRGDRWACIESTEYRQAEEALGRVYAGLTKRMEARGSELVRANVTLQEKVDAWEHFGQRLRFSDAAFRSIRESVIAVDADQAIVYWNEASEAIYGIDAADAIGSRYSDVVETVETFPSETAALLERLERTGHVHSEVYHRTKRAEVWVDISVHEMRDETGQRPGFIALATDITDRKQAEEALLDSEERYSSLVNNVRLGIFRSTPGANGKFLEVNPAMEEITGYSRGELLEMDVADLYADPDLRQAVAERAAATDGKVTTELTFRRKDGDEIVISDTKFAVRDGAGQLICFDGVLEDITERRLAENRRRDLEQRALLSSRMASIGEMASGIAHEINNPVASIVGLADLLLEGDIPPDVREDIGVIHAEAERVAGIVRKLLTFSRRSDPERELVNVNEIVQTTLDVRAYEIGTSNIDVVTSLDPELPATMADGSQLQQVFLNLIINAEMAMREKGGRGRLRIETGAEDGMLRVVFIDNGPGIAPEILDKIFDPFFTTRKKGQGTGLGLSVCHGIVSEHGGRIHATSTGGKGATFAVELPIVCEEKPAELPEPDVEVPLGPSTARILAVDDEPAVLRFLARALGGSGYLVDCVDSARDVVERLRRAEYDLVLLDIKLPGTSGIDIYRHIQRRIPAVAKRIIFITGDIIAADTRSFLARTKARHIVKPFSAERLRKEVTRALAENS
ncbi:MAG: PAS domain S-box protein [Dehalococcoidales bacterium]